MFLFTLAATVLAAGLWLAQEPRGAAKKPQMVSVIQLTTVDSRTLEGFKEGMAALGYREDQDIVYLYDGPAGTIDRLEPMIRRHLEKKPDLVFVSSTPATLAVKHAVAGTTVPVVFAPVNDPVAAGIVASLKTPGGQVTGIKLPLGDDVRLEWLTRIAPGVKRVYLPYNPADKSALTSLELARRAASRLGVTILPQEVRASGNIPALLAAFPADADAIFLPRDSTVESGIDDFVAFSLQRKLPLCAPSLLQTQAGALFSYGFAHRLIGRQAARLADQILRGTAPADLPVETAENQLAVNLRTARAIGLAIPAEILMQAEEVIRP
jgi:putative ABC transport system substrate-binding protein